MGQVKITGLMRELSLPVNITGVMTCHAGRSLERKQRMNSNEIIHEAIEACTGIAWAYRFSV